MPSFEKITTINYTPKQIYDVVADVANYPAFLPWCHGARIYNQKDNQFDADVLLGFKSFRERFTSRVRLIDGKSIEIEYLRGPMKRLYNHWYFEPMGETQTTVDFKVDVALKNIILEKLVTGMFAEATEKIMQAFFDRAATLYDGKHGDEGTQKVSTLHNRAPGIGNPFDR